MMKPIHYIHLPTANCKEQIIAPRYIILHCIGGSEQQALNILTQPLPIGGGVSAHYFIPTYMANTAYQLVTPNKIAYHAGKSVWQTDSDLNHCSIGIELHSPNYAQALSGSLNWLHFEPFTEQQIATTIALIKVLQKKFAIPPQHILAHSDIAPWRLNQQGEIILGKTDPGATFPWQRLAQAGIGLWPKQAYTPKLAIDTSIAYVQRLLRQYGYNIPLHGHYDLATQYTITAFQLHFMPDTIDGQISKRMVMLLENLITQAERLQE